MNKKIFLIFLVLIIGVFIIYAFFINKNSQEFMKEFRNENAILRVWGTEYFPFSNGKVFAQLLDNNNRPIDDAVCYITIYYPNGFKFVDNYIMSKLEKGLYFYDFIVPDIEGVYMVYVECNYRFDEVSMYAKSVSLSAVSTVSGSDELSFTYYFDGLRYGTRASSSAGTLTFTFDTINESIDYYYVVIKGHVDLISGTYASVNSGIFILNTCTNTYEKLGEFTYYMYSLSFLVNTTCHNPPTVRFTYSGTNYYLYLDLLNIVYFRNATAMIYNIRGGGEVHVSKISADAYGIIPNVRIIT